MTPARTLPFATLLARHRRAAGLTQEELAERAGVSARAVSDLERGAKQRPHRETVALLADALGLGPDERAALEQAVRPLPMGSVAGEQRAQGSAAAIAPSATGTSHTPDERAGMLPPQLTPLVGREREEAAAVHLLRREGVRLLTLTGTGGVGKTRLAVQVAGGLRTDFADGVWFVRLAPLTDPALVIPTIAQAVGVHESGSQPIAETLRAHLAEWQALLLLDNCEQVASAAPEIAKVLAACPRVKALATSRAPLGVRGEQQMEVPPLALPDGAEAGTAGQVSDVEQIQASPAVALFVQRAQAVQPDFELTTDHAAVVAAICRRLDGLPLALELAAAWIKVLPPMALLARLERRLPLLPGGARDLPERQQTMEHTIGWSEDLLTASERELFRRLAVFVGGATLEAVEAVCQAPEGAAPLASNALVDLGALVAQSLVQPREEAGEARFGMLRVIREYALGQLEASGEADALRRTHAAYFLALAERIAPELSGPARRVWHERLARDHDNVRAVLAWAREQGEVEMGLRLAAAVTRFWVTYGFLREGRTWMESLLAFASQEAEDGAPSAVSMVVWARALYASGTLAMFAGDYATARTELEQALPLVRAANDLETAEIALSNLGQIAQNEGDLERAKECFEQALALDRVLGSPGGIAGALTNLGSVAHDLGDLELTTTYTREALALFRQTGNHLGAAICLANLGQVAQQRGEFAQAETLGCEALVLFREIGSPRRCTEGLEVLAGIAGAAGQGVRAARLLGAAAAQREALEAPQPAHERAEMERSVAPARAALGEEAWTAAFTAGRALALEQAVAEALGEPALGEEAQP